MIKEVWESTDILLEYDNITLKDSIAKDLFKMGNVLQKIGIFELAAEHHGTSFSISPSAESACYLDMTFPINNDDSLAWQRVAMAGYLITPVLVFWTLRVLHWVKFTFETGFELPSSCRALP
jgi:hypothetical protein